MNVISIKSLTKDYQNNKGIFDINIEVNEGEVFGFLGPNGAGKSTTMRHLMGFSKANSGVCQILNEDCWTNQKEIQKHVGYLPGEISLPEDMNGLAYLKLIAKMRKMNDFSYAIELLDYFEIDPKTSIKRMSKGMKQKIAIVAAFMHDPKVLLLDEPTSGLDPLMQSRFISLILEEKKKGKTIILSSHLFEEVEKTCDRVVMIRNGKIIQEFSIDELKHSSFKTYKIEFSNLDSLNYMKSMYKDATYNDLVMSISLNDKKINDLIKDLAKVDILYLKEEKHTLEDYFMKFYGGSSND